MQTLINLEIIFQNTSRWIMFYCECHKNKAEMLTLETLDYETKKEEYTSDNHFLFCLEKN